jgi:hypothetical protein
MKNVLIKLSQILILSGLAGIFFIQCESDNETKQTPKDPDQAEIATIDRFSDEAGTLMKRSENPDLPGPDEPINFDQAPFITQSFGPEGNVVKYYNFDIQPLNPAPIYVLFKEGKDSPVEDQLNIINSIPGDLTYNDFWLIKKVIVPDDYVANTVTSYQEIADKDYEIELTNKIVNCPVVPKGSTADLKYSGGSHSLDRGWYKNKIVYYFTFEEKELSTTSDGIIPVSPIYVTFNTNGEPSTGFVTEEGSNQTHNVVATLPSASDYSPLWQVHVYDNSDFDSVTDLSSAQSSTILNSNAGFVNCPLIYKE